MDIFATKMELIKIITDSESERLLHTLKEVIKEFSIENNYTILKKKLPVKNRQKQKRRNQILKPTEIIALAKEPTPETADLEQLKKEQGYSTEKLFDFLDNLDRSIWEGEDLRELSAMLTR